jgi:2,4-dienoyl-CoA reductase-like NADH-dependent reductase (Old Yellow Enzyme family)
VQSEWPENLPLLVRISASDWAEGGWNLEESIQLSKILKERGAIDVSSGGAVSHQQIPLGPNYQVAFAESKNETGIPAGLFENILKLLSRANYCLRKSRFSIV